MNFANIYLGAGLLWNRATAAADQRIPFCSTGILHTTVLH